MTIESLSAQIKSSATGSNCEIQLPFTITPAGLTTIRTKRNDICYYDLNTGKVSLVLTNEQRAARQIGTIWDFNGSNVYSKIVNKNHLHKNTNSYGLNSIVINNLLNDNDIVLLYTNKKRSKGYMIPVRVVKEKGQYYDFGLQSQGTEKQIFVDIKLWDECK